jgi:hypothetical protein
VRITHVFMANKKINDFTTEATSPVDDDFLEIESTVEGSRKIRASNLVPQGPVAQTPSGNFLKSGGGFAHTEDLDIAVGVAEYYIQGVLHQSPANVLTLATADATHPRIDAIVLNSSGVAAVVTGTPAASPARPVIDPSTQLELTFITVDALATEPEVNVDPIYLENTEWTTTPSSVRIDPDDTTGERTGTKAIKFIAAIAGDNIKFVDAAPFVLDAFEHLTFWINPVTFVNQKQILLQCRNADAIVGVTVSLRNGRYGLNTATAAYQLVVIPVSEFGLNGALIDEIRQTVAGGSTALTCFIDDIALQGGASSAAARGMLNPMTDEGDFIVGGPSGGPQRRARGAADTAIKHFSITFDPKAVCDGDTDRLAIMTVGPDFPNGIKITRWNCSALVNPDTELDLDFKRADAFIGVANAAVVDVVDTTAGVSSETTEANINGDAAVANGKVLYLEFGTPYTDEGEQVCFEFWGYAI